MNTAQVGQTVGIFRFIVGTEDKPRVNLTTHQNVAHEAGQISAYQFLKNGQQIGTGGYIAERIFLALSIGSERLVQPIFERIVILTEKTLLCRVVIRQITEKCLPILKAVITSHARTLGSCQNKIFHKVNSRQWRTSVIQRLKKRISLRMTSNLYLNEYRFRYLALDFEQSLDCITGLFNVLI